MVEFVDAQEAALFLSVFTLGELQKGVSKLADSRKKAELQTWLDHELVRRFGNQLLVFDAAVASTWGILQGESAQRGEPLPIIDSLIAATAITHGLVVATRNTADLERCGARTFNPWSA